MRVLIDYHHADLFESHLLTMHDRFGWDVYRPIGMEWFDQWYWNFEREWHGDAVAHQYLDIWSTDTQLEDRFERYDTTHPGRVLQMVTLDQFMQSDWDLIISSVPSNARGFEKLARLKGAAWVIHVGNQWGDEQWERMPNAAILTTTSTIPPSIPHVVVHQEFSLADFRYEEPSGFGPVRSFVNCFPETPEYPNFQRTAALDPDLGWEVYGALGTGVEDQWWKGELNSTPAVAEAMRGSGVIWHAKHWSDGFGHVIHDAFAVGRPVFGYQRYYADKLAGPLWIEGKTSFDVERHGPMGSIGLIRELQQDRDRYLRMCEDAAARFREVVSFDEDADKLKALLENAMSVPA